MEIIETIKESYELKGVGSPEYYLGSDYLSVADNNNNAQLKGIATVDNEENDHNISTAWLK